MPDTVGMDESQFEWENVHEESPDQIVFTEIGDTYIGEYLGQEVIDFTDKKTGEADSFTQLRFRDPEGLKVINAGYELLSAFKGIEPGTPVRVRYAKNVDVGQASPMKSYRVDAGRVRGNTKGK